MSWPEPPSGFARRVDGPRAAYVSSRDAEEFAALGFDRPEAWERTLAGRAASRGRGATAVFDRPAGPQWRLKRMMRGGFLGSVWRDRYPSARRLVRNLAVSDELLRRGVPGARPVGLLLESGPGPLVRGWLAFEEIAGAENLADRRLRGALTREDLAAALAAVRALHDAGIVHPDLNLGNVLVRSRAGATEAFVIDLDRARARHAPAAVGPRVQALRRLERSCAKLTGSPAPFGPGSEGVWYSLYAGGDTELAGRLERSRAVGRVALALHRIGWRKDGR